MGLSGLVESTFSFDSLCDRFILCVVSSSPEGNLLSISSSLSVCNHIKNEMHARARQRRRRRWRRGRQQSADREKVRQNGILHYDTLYTDRIAEH